MVNLNEKKKFHFIYKTTNLLNGKYYIGMHSTSNLKDGYIGSGKRLKDSVRKYGKENFKCKILEFLPDRQLLAIREREIVNCELIKETQCMNIMEGGSWGNDEITAFTNRTKRKGKTWEEIYNTPDIVDMMRHMVKENYKYTLEKYNFKNLPKEDLIKIAKMGSPIRTAMGYKHSDETKKRIGDANRCISHIDRYGEEKTVAWHKKISVATKEAMKKVDRYLIGQKSVEGRVPFWNRKHEEQRNIILEMKSGGKSSKEIMFVLNISVPTYYKRIHELIELGYPNLTIRKDDTLENRSYATKSQIYNKYIKQINT